MADHQQDKAMTTRTLAWLYKRIAVTAIIFSALSMTATTLNAQNPARELSAAEIRSSVVGRTFDIVFRRATGERVDAVITVGADGRWHGNNRFTPARQDGTATNVFDGRYRMRGNRLCQQNWVVSRNGQTQSPGPTSSEACFRWFMHEGRLVAYNEGSGTQAYWTPRN